MSMRVIACLGLGLWVGSISCSTGGGSAVGFAANDSSNEVAGVLTDWDGDGNLDLLRVSTETQPVAILQALFGDGRGRFLDNTPNLTETTLSGSASRALIARLSKGRLKARGLELLRVQEADETRFYFVIFG